MVKKREKPNYKRHLIILTLTVVVFFIGTFIGNQLDSSRLDDLNVKFEDETIHLQQIITGEKFISYLISSDKLDEKGCEVVEDLYLSNINLLGKTRDRLEQYTKEAENPEEFLRIRKSFTEQQINFWILANKIQKSCDSGFNTILYFYSNTGNCESCDNQGIYLSYVKKKLQEDVFIFAMNLDVDTSARMLRDFYNVSSEDFPTLIINEKKYGYSTKDEIFEALNVSVE